MNLILLFIIPFILAFFRKHHVILSLIPLLFLVFGVSLDSEFRVPWFPALSLEFYFSVDSLSLLFLYLTAIVIPFSLIIAPKEHSFAALVFILEGLLFGFFMARDLVLFTIFFEAMLFPLFLILYYWGRESVAYKFLLYMIAGSALMILGVIALFFTAHTFDIGALSGKASPYIFLLFLLAFAVKTPLFPFHGWLADAYTAAPYAGSILLAAVLSKGGIYGLARIGLEIFPSQFQEYSVWLLPLAIVGVLYAALVAWVQDDYKRLIAYSSLSHVNFVLAGLFVLNEIGITGALLQAFNHGITITALFLVASWLNDRLGTRSISENSGLAKFMPHLAWLTLFFVLASIALPGTSNFVGEILILYGLFLRNTVLAFVLGISIILSAIYMLRFMQKSYFGPPSFFKDAWVDISRKELLMALPLVLLILGIGIYPTPLIELAARWIP